ncbi:hypothetical protein HYDPIDRAFT_35905 [Hydnomerulius pinastri MD-312]|nr:hypothetical protein HYDPIDRAFT_35905 [Hydnomerulius pinastri MD-312]
MGWFSEDSEEYQQNSELKKHGSNITHDLLAGAVAYEVSQKYEEHCRENGKPVEHAQAKSLLAAFAASAATQLLETKGADAWDEHKHKKAVEQVTEDLSRRVEVDYE